MDDHQLRAQLIRLAHAQPELREHILPMLKESGDDGWKLKFPHHQVVEVLQKLFERELMPYARDVQAAASKDPTLKEHHALLQKAIETYVALLAQIKRAENSLYTR